MTTEAANAAATAAPANDGAAAAAAQAAAPAAAAAPAQPNAAAAPAAQTQAEQGPTPTTWGKTGDAGLDMALNFIGQRGFGQSHPAVQEAMKGNFSLLRAELAGMGDKAVGYEAYVALAEKAYNDTVKTLEETEQAAIAAVLEVVGTPENWQAIHAWAKANADEDERAEINAMLAGSPRQARAAAIYLQRLYENANGTAVEPTRAVKETASGGYSPAGNGPITDPKEYSKLVSELHRKLGNKMEGSPEYAALNQRRLQGRRIQR